MKIRTAKKIVNHAYNRDRYDVEETHPKRRRYMHLYKKAYHRLHIYNTRAIRKQRRMGKEFLSASDIDDIFAKLRKEFNECNQ